MPDTRSHRGPHPDDARLFAPQAVPVLRTAVGELSWLLTKGYAPASSLKLVGDRHQLDARQRIAVARCACSDAQKAHRCAREVPPESLRGGLLRLDGYNVLTTLEAALAGGVILAARDGAYRDMASMHGSYRKVEETLPALELLGQAMSDLGIAEAWWYLDQPVSNSGRLKGMMMGLAAQRGWRWRVELAANPDAVLMEGEATIASADSVVIDHCAGWFNLARRVVESRVPAACVVDLSSP